MILVFSTRIFRNLDLGIEWVLRCKAIVTWSTTERRKIRNLPYPSVFELTGRQRLTIKRGIRNVGQFLVAEVTNPCQNESQEMLHSVTGWKKKWV